MPYAVTCMDEPAKTDNTDRRKRECCPVCTGRNIFPERKIRDHMSRATFEVNKCSDCTVRFIADPPKLETLDTYYANEAGTRMYRPGSRLHRNLRRLLLNDELKPLTRRLNRNAEILDFGAGDGAVAETLKAKGYKVSALDMYPKSEWPYPEINYQQGNLNTPLPPYGPTGTDKTTRAVIMRHSLEHIFDPIRVLCSMRYADVKYILIITPNYESIFRPLFGEYWYYWDPPRHLAYYSKKSIYCLAERCGYKLVESTTYAIDEAVTSMHRCMLLNNRSEQSALARKLIRMSDPKSPAAAISSCIASFFGNCVIHALLEKYRQN